MTVVEGVRELTTVAIKQKIKITRLEAELAALRAENTALRGPVVT